VSVEEYNGAADSPTTGTADAPLALPTATDGVALWWFALAPPAAGLAPLEATLSPAEHARAARFGTPLLRARYVVGRAVLRRLLAEVLGVEPGAVPIRRGVRGRPAIAGDRAVDFNVSHTAGHALVGIAHAVPAATRIGVDVERVDRAVNADRLAARVLAPREAAVLATYAPEARRQRFLRHWTSKEAMSKATGDGLAAPFRRLDVDAEAELRLVAGPAPYLPGSWVLRAVAVPAGFLATLAVWTGAPPPEAAGNGP
jgi:4'-phosphopantetheinyl transferase